MDVGHEAVCRGRRQDAYIEGSVDVCVCYDFFFLDCRYVCHRYFLGSGWVMTRRVRFVASCIVFFS